MSNTESQNKNPKPITISSKISKIYLNIYTFLRENVDRIPNYTMAIFAIVTSLLAYYAWHESVRSTTALENQLKVMRAGQRPYVSSGAITGPIMAGDAHGDRVIMWNVAVGNFGREVALSATYKSRIKIGDAGFTAAYDGPENDKIKVAPIDLPPGRTVLAQIASPPGFDESYFSKLLTVRHALQMSIEIEYYGISHEEHYVSSVCVEHDPHGEIAYLDPDTCR